jgi:spore coat polysaccharide biosynthesis predicted glycosyltransferase SpsG
MEITVVIGSSYSHKEELLDYVDGYEGKSRISIKQNVNNISELMSEADIAISAGGSTCWELACLGLPNMILVVAENQAPIANDLDKREVSVNLGWFEDVQEEDIKDNLSRLIKDVEKRRSMSENGMRLVDGGGVDRVIKEVNESFVGCC